MALLNPVYAAIVPFLFIVTVPLALFAGITTTLAFAVLICRVLVVYLDIALTLVNQSLLGVKIPLRLQQAAIRSNSPSPTRAGQSLSFRRRRRRPSSVSIGTITPVHDASLGLTPSVGAERDFEGVGGWRTGDDDAIWTTFNSRLELPDRQHNRNHHRSPSGGPTTPGEGGYLMMKRRNRSPEQATTKVPTSPNSSRTRTPSATRISFAAQNHSDSYFPLSMSSKPKKTSPI